MRTYILIVLFICHVIVAPTICADSSPMTPINDLFDGMREKDAAKIEQQFSPNAVLQRVQIDGAIVNSNIAEFAKRVASSDNHLNEQLIKAVVFREGPLATVWTPFVFYIDGTLSYCGVNSFDLVKIKGRWKIQSIIDVQHQGDCERFKASL